MLSNVSILNVKVRYFTTLRELAGSAEEEIETESHASLANLVETLASKYGKDARTYSYHKEEKLIRPFISWLMA